jgi:thiol-disulfide isomerase/thioredoxin
MSPIFIELSKKYPGLIFLKVDVDEVPVSVFFVFSPLTCYNYLLAVGL